MSRLTRNDNGSFYCWDCKKIVILFDNDYHTCCTERDHDMTSTKPTTIPQAIIDDALANISVNNMGAGLKECYVASMHFDLDEGEPDIRFCVSSDRDDFADINDSDCYGKVEYVDDRSNWSIHPRPRPKGFDGAARKLHFGGDTYWWQPWDAAEWGQLDSVEQRSFLSTVRDLIEFGFSILTVQVEYQCGCCGQWAELASSSLGGIDTISTYHGIIDEVLYAALDEADITTTTVEAAS